MNIKKKYMLFIQGMVILFIFSFILFYNLNRPRVMVLHSYANGLPEVVAFNKGFETIQQNLKNPYIIHSYMNVSVANSKGEILKMGLKAQEFIQEFNPEIIVAVGEEAQEYAARYYANDHKVKVVFACIKDGCGYGYKNASNVTGVVEHLPIKPLKKIVKKTYKEALKRGEEVNLFVLGDKSFQTIQEHAHLEKQAWAPLKMASIRQVESFDEWKQAIHHLKNQGGHGVLLISGVSQLNLSQEVRGITQRDVLRWTVENSPYPVIGLREAHHKQGLPLTVAPASRQSGERVADYVQKLIRGVPIKDLPLVTNDHFLIRERSIAPSNRLTLPSAFRAMTQGEG